jgi:UDP-glucose 4-epimerase
MKVLITGGSGFIGSHIVEHFQGKAEVRVLDNLRSGFLKNLEGFKVEFIEGSILDRNLVRKAVQGVDYIFHLAAMISVPESMQKPIECNEINAVGLLNVLEEASAAKVKKLSLSSSAAIYGDNPITPKLESMVPEPKSPYAITKLDGEYYCKMFHDEKRINTVCLRYFNVFGPRQDPKSQYAAAVPIFIDRAIKNEPITIFGDGEQTRDFIYVKDIAAANVYFATHPSHTGVFNVAYGKKISINDLAQKICRLTKSTSEIKHLAERSGDVKHSLASVDRLTQAGFTASSNFDDGLQATIDFFRTKRK